MPEGKPLAVKPHSVVMENRTKALLSGITQVVMFDDMQITLLTDAGEVSLTGEGLHLTKLTLDEGDLIVEGRIDGVQYQNAPARKGLFRRSRG